jgi:hypothetical protein
MPNHFSNWGNCIDGTQINGADVRIPGNNLDDAVYNLQQGILKHVALGFDAWGVLAISGGLAITPTRALHVINSGTLLETINLTSSQSLLFLRAAGVTVTVRHGTGNIYLQDKSDVYLDSAGRRVLQLVNEGSVWLEVGATARLRPAFDAHRNGTNQSVNDSTYTKVQCGTEALDTAFDYDAVTSHRFLPGVQGWYDFNLASAWVSALATTVELRLALLKNGAVIREVRRKATNVALDTLNASWIDIANGTTDYFEMFVLQTSGGATNLSGDPTVTRFSGSFLGSF